MKIGVPKEIKPQESRIGLTPDSVKVLISNGHEVLVENNGGFEAGFYNDQYKNVGAKIIDKAEDIFNDAEIIVKVKEPLSNEVKMIRENQIVFTYLHLAAAKELTQGLINSKSVCIAYETVTDNNGRLPLLAPMSAVAGRMSVQAGAHCLEKNQKGRGLLLGGAPGVQPGNVVILGGGVVGDIAGFVASTYMRGIKYYQIPTTLLAMVDSSIGGKTGLNYLRTKNIIGTIYQPDSVLIDPELLSTLPVDETISGIGEIIKYGAIHDSEFLINLNEWVNDLNSFPYSIAIERCCEIKAEVVSADEKENDQRRILNFGHTVGHALESHIGYDSIRHGEAISYGMKCASWISNKKSLINNDEYNFMIELINKLPLPKLDGLDYDQIIQYINFDKKYHNGKLSFILLNGLGNTKIDTDISKEIIRKSLKALE